LAHSSANSSISALRNASAGSVGSVAGAGCAFSISSISGVESCKPRSSGATTSGMTGIFAYLENSGALAALRGIQRCGICL